MKKKVLALAFIFALLFSITAFAEEQPTVEAKVNGKIQTGEKIKILINISNINSFFAGSIDLKYDTKVLKVNSLEQGDLIKQNGINKFDAINKIDAQKGIVSYGFSCTGNINGFSGSGTFVVINAEVMKNDSFHINSQPFLKQPNDDMNLKIILCDSNIKQLNYKFVPYGVAANNQGTAGMSDNGSFNTVATGSNSNSNENNNAVGSSGGNNQGSTGTTEVNNGSKATATKNGNTTTKTGSSTINNTGGTNNNKAESTKNASANGGATDNSSSNSKNTILIISLIIIIAGGVSGYFIYIKK